jgi:chromosomal replication initiator protein
MPPKSTSSSRPSVRGAARDEWTPPRKAQSSRNGEARSDYTPNYDADYEAENGRRRTYTLTLPGMESDFEDRSTFNALPAYHANLQNGSNQGDNKPQRPSHSGKPTAMLDADEHSSRGMSSRDVSGKELANTAAKLLANELDPSLGEADEEAVPIGRETAAEFDPHAIWRMVLSELALQMPSSTYDTWVRDTVVIGYEDGEFIIGMPNAYARDWLENRLRHTIKRTLSSIMHRAVQIQFRVRSRPMQEPTRTAAAPLYQAVVEEPVVTNSLNSPSNPNSQRAQVGHGQVGQSIAGQARTEFDAQETAQEEIMRDSPSNGGYNAPPTAAPYPPPNSGRERTDEFTFSTQLNPYHNFETFVVGNHNRLAHAAALAIVDSPGHSFNPLFIYGGVGLGKTHLLNAIGNSLRQKGFRLIYCSSEQFTNEIISSIRNQSTEQFRAKYRQADVLLIDDIQFIGGKDSTEEEFFHTFNHLHAAGKQVVLSSDRPPKALPRLDDRLRSRFEGGLQTDIAQPDFETRVAILQSKANRMGVPLPYDVLLLVAERVDSNIRELEGALNRLSMQARLTNQTLNLALAKSLLENLAPQRLPCPPAGVVRIVAEHFGLRIEDLTGRKRTKEIANARQIAMYLLREENDLSLPAIGDQLGGRDHSTVRYGVERVAEDLDHDEGLRMTILTLRDKVYAPPVG